MSRRLRVSLVFVATLIAFAAQAAAQIPSPDGTFFACVRLDHDNDTGRLMRLVASAEPCRPNELRIHWFVSGPQGPQGPAGPAGPQGPAGAPGAPGAPDLKDRRACKVSLVLLVPSVRKGRPGPPAATRCLARAPTGPLRAMGKRARSVKSS
jgi:hypothetical protein